VFSVFNYYKVVSINRKTKAKVTQGLEVGDKILLTMIAATGGYAATVDLAKYEGSGNDHDPSNYRYVGTSTQGNISNLISFKKNTPITIKAIGLNFPVSGSVDRTIEGERENYAAIGVNRFGYVTDSDLTLDFMRSLEVYNPLRELTEEDTQILNDQIRESYVEMSKLPDDASDEEVQACKDKIYESLRIFAKFYDLDERVLGI